MSVIYCKDRLVHVVSSEADSAGFNEVDGQGPRVGYRVEQHLDFDKRGYLICRIPSR